MAADVNAILLAREGQAERDHEFFTAIYGAAGIKLPPLDPEKPTAESAKASIRAWARQHNKQFAAQQAAKARATPKPKSD